MPFCCFEAFWGKFIEIFFFRHKIDYIRYEHWNTQKVCFSYHIWKWQILRKIWNCLNNFVQTSKRRKILTKTVFLLKVSHILLNYAFLLFWSILWYIHRELFFLDIKVTNSETSTEILRKFIFVTMFEMGQSWVKFGFT